MKHATPTRRPAQSDTPTPPGSANDAEDKSVAIPDEQKITGIPDDPELERAPVDVEHPARQDPETGNDVDPGQKEPAGPGRYSSGIDDPDHPTERNPGHANPAHNTPGHVRRDQPGQSDQGHPAQGKTQTYPGIMGRKARALKERDDNPD